MIPFQSSTNIRYDGSLFELSVATSIASPGVSIGGMPYAFTVTLDHRLRIWNLKTRKLAYSGDLLHKDEVDTPENARKVIDPSQSKLVKVYPEGRDSVLCVTYSPINTGAFKFWNVISAGEEIVLTDMFPQKKLEPERPTWEEWTMADFSVVIDASGPNTYALWVLWKNNVTYRLRRLDFGRGSSWGQSWEAMAMETLHEAPLPKSFPGNSSGSTDSWLRFILNPARFTMPTIETGLTIYENGQGSRKGLVSKSGSLAERMCATIASTASLSRTSDGDMDFDQFRASVDTQWRRFYRLLLELDKQRGEAMSLVVDPEGKMPWVVLADGITAIRACSALERIKHNTETSSTQLAVDLLSAASTFRDSFSEQLMNNCQAMVLEEVFQEPSMTDAARMRLFYEKCDFSNQIGDDEFAQLQAGLGGNFTRVTFDVYNDLLERMVTSESKKQLSPLPLTELGRKLIVKGVQEIVELHRNVCLDQLVLLVLIENEINHTEEGTQFDTAIVFNCIIEMLKRLELISWLASTQITLSLEDIGRSNSITDQVLTPKKSVSRTETITLLELVFRHLFSLDLQEEEALSIVITKVILQICTPGTNEYQTTPAAIQGHLLKHGRADLATEFSRFAGRDAFSIYIQGRACLAANDIPTAAMLFKKAAFGMCM